MSDRPGNTDDFEDDDFEDLDDGLDDGDDLIDEDLESDDLDGEWDDEADTTGKTSFSSNTGGKKSSSNLIVPAAIAIAVLGGGGYFYLTQMSGSSQPAPLSYEQDPDAVGAIDSAPMAENIPAQIDSAVPMPAPIAAPEQDEFIPPYAEAAENPSEYLDAPANIASSTQDFAPIAGEEDNVLTPMPGLGEGEDQGTELLPLENQISDIGINPVEAEEIPLAQANTAEEKPLDEIFENPVELQMDAVTQPSPEAVITENDPATQPVLDAATIAPQEESTSVPVTTPTMPGLDNIADTTQPLQNEALSKLEGEVSSLQSLIKERDDAISSLNSQIASLQSQIDNQKRALDTAEQARAKAENAVKEVKTAPEKEASAEVKPSKPAPKPLVPALENKKPAASAEPVGPTWELRAAQPGRAYIGIKGAKDMQVVEVGHTLQGIGRITSIAQEGGAWVVRGTRGQIRQ